MELDEAVQRVLRHHVKLIALCLAVGLGLGWVISLGTARRYSASARIVIGTRGTRCRFQDEVLVDQPLEGAIEGGRPEPHLAFGAREDLLHDAVPVLFLFRQGEEYMKPVGFEGEEAFGCARLGHDEYIYRLIYSPHDEGSQGGDWRRGEGFTKRKGGFQSGSIAQSVDSGDHRHQCPRRGLERSRWRGGRYAWRIGEALGCAQE